MPSSGSAPWLPLGHGGRYDARLAHRPDRAQESPGHRAQAPRSGECSGYDLRHFLASGIVPATVTAIISGYWHLDGLAKRGLDADRTGERAKLASMLLVGHTIATSGNLIKTGLLFGMNPLALNWAQLLAMAPVTVAWIAETVARDVRIRRGLDDEWQRLLAESEALARSATGR